ncbi:putative eukaryotic translation initiation factor 3 subunit E-B-like [Apostichopus japonicus]|uniref:Eukaryotic translation initiation factor 3 subunit E n=1 Tax=Stichopus japonicus TaxID=307972 RepID=A0A2G8KX95_STIJA|nr:putative eukaryotic translation initiation factor 3 subunit E-B-like [Apostichopus japonicus]
MVDFAMDVFRQLYPNQEVPKTLRDKRSSVVTQLKQLQSETEPIIKIFEDQTVVEQIESTRDGRDLFQFLEKEHNFKLKMLDTLYAYAKFQYECGNYTGATEYLSFHRVLVPPEDKRAISSLWGKLASEILMQNWDAIMEDLQRLQEVIDSNQSFTTPLQMLQQRNWLIHWSLFVYFNHPQGREFIIERFLYQAHYLNAIQTACPHILRYLTTAVITNKSLKTKRQQVLKDLVKVIQQETYTYRDPITEFIECLYVNFDFDMAQQKLRECETVLTNDFFLVALLDDFIENARHLIFETFCRIHNCISIDMLAEKLNMASEQAERWIVNLIRDAPRDAPLDAKIDSKLGHVVMGIQNVSPINKSSRRLRHWCFAAKTWPLILKRRRRP